VNARKGTEFLNMASVKVALHVDPSLDWEICSSKLNYHDITETVVPIYNDLLYRGKYRVLVYSGDADTVVSYHGTWAWIKAELKATPSGSVWHQWRYDDPQQGQPQVGGFATIFSHNFTFITVKGAAHMVPQSNPRPALHFFSRFLANRQI
jgi:serine carboxypeptidase-like clade 1